MVALNLYDLGARPGSDPYPAWLDAMAQLSAAGGGRLVIDRRFEAPPRPGPFCLDMTADNVTIEFIGEGALAMPVGMPARQVALLRLNERKGCKIIGGTFDGQWGNAVGLVDDHIGINHATQTDPKSHLISVRGCSGFEAHDVRLKDSYGDGIWIGHRVADNDPTTPETQATDIVLRNVRCDMTARNGLTFGGPSERVRVENCHFTNAYACAVDFEPNSRVAYVDFVGGYAGPWWAPGEGANHSVVVDGGGPNAQFAERITFGSGFACDGNFLIQRARDIDVRRCHLRTTWGGKSWAPMFVRWNAHRIMIVDNDITDYNLPIQATPTQNNQNTHAAAVHVDYYASSTSVYAQPHDVTIQGNRIRAMGVHGIRACGSSAELNENEIELLENAAGVRGRGIDIFAEKPDMEVRTRGNRIRNANGPAIRARFSSALNAMRELRLVDDTAWDDRDYPMCTVVTQIDPQRYAASLFASATAGTGVPTAVIGYP